MLRVIFGVALGIYLAQNYDIPNIELLIDQLQNTLMKYRKPPKH